MKNLLLIWTVVLGSTVTRGQTNLYHPFPDTDAVWTVVDAMSHGGTYCDNISCDRSYIQKGDTIINSIKYNKLYLNEHCTEDWIPAPPPATPCNYDYGVTTGTFVGGLRNDSANKKVYYFDKTSNQECLIYDFNVNVGDSVPNYWSSCASGPTYWKVTSIDSALVGAVYHKKFNVNGQLPDTSIIEGVGSLTGLFGPYVFFENSNKLICLSVLGQTLFTNPNSSSQCGIVAVNKIRNNFKLSILPNPFSTQTIFQADDLLNNATLTVDNCFGQTVAHIKNLSGQTITFNRDNLPSGLYFVRLTADHKFYIDKLVITDK